ncbi:hypothetical protein KKH07_02230 [Patescibacteria group bacterium]|nr:hypothetical protein [Patescibacteria group bacterium]MBU1563785.1 hypothetical protein [Patescibacteria group bacterium]MBU2068096.1 hypothetical protein [Patescibacteria group bacterium]
MIKRQKTKILFKTSKIYQSKVLEFQRYIEGNNPVFFVNNLCNLKELEKVIIIHKPLKFAAEFELPDKILVDFRNSFSYIALCLAHEYTHLLLRSNVSVPYPIEQSLAILIQLTYEDSAKIRKFSKKTIKELMEYMNVWPDNKILLDNWLSYWNFRTGRNIKYCSILSWLKEVL